MRRGPGSMAGLNDTADKSSNCMPRTAEWGRANPGCMESMSFSYGLLRMRELLLQKGEELYRFD